MGFALLMGSMYAYPPNDLLRQQLWLDPEILNFLEMKIL